MVLKAVVLFELIPCLVQRCEDRGTDHSLFGRCVLRYLYDQH